MMKSRKSAGATLLEVMLVLAVAAMVIVMSIKYYKNAQNSQNANAIMTQVNAILAAGDQIAQGNSGSYATVSTATVSAIIGTAGMVNPYGNSMTISSAATTTYTINTGAIPGNVCSIVKSLLASGANTKLTSTTTCSTTGTTNLAILYTSTTY